MRPVSAVVAGQRANGRSGPARLSQAELTAPSPPRHHSPIAPEVALADAERLVAVERRLLLVIQWIVFGGVIF
jgi:hypothetical protein